MERLLSRHWAFVREDSMKRSARRALSAVPSLGENEVESATRLTNRDLTTLVFLPTACDFEQVSVLPGLRSHRGEYSPVDFPRLGYTGIDINLVPRGHSGP
jgi:hypothetical protein